MKKSVGQNQRKPRFRISKLIFPIAALALIAGCTSFACIRGRVENDQPIVSNAENPEVISDANNYGRYYEYTHAWTVAISFVNHDLSSDYTTPLDYYETTNGRSGKIGTGQLTVTGTNLERKGYFHPANSFDYTSYSVGSDVSVTFNYQPPTTSSRLKEYTITDCRTKSLDGYSLPGQMGTGALLILKRRTGASSWTLDKTFVGLKPGTPVKYTPSASDIFYGTYYRFVCGYQYYYLDHEDTYWISAFNIKQYGFVDCLQRTNLFLARGKTDVRFISGHTEVKTHQLEAETYLANVTYDEDLKANCLFLNEENKIENSIVLTHFQVPFQPESILKLQDDPPFDRHGNLIIYSLGPSDWNLLKFYSDKDFKEAWRIDLVSETGQKRTYSATKLDFIEDDGISYINFLAKDLPLRGKPQFLYGLFGMGNKFT